MKLYIGWLTDNGIEEYTEPMAVSIDSRYGEIAVFIVASSAELAYHKLMAYKMNEAIDCLDFPEVLF